MISCCLLVHCAHLEFVFLLCVGLCAVYNKWLAVLVNTSCLVLVALHKMGGVALYKCFPPSRTSLLLLSGNYFRQLWQFPSFCWCPMTRVPPESGGNKTLWPITTSCSWSILYIRNLIEWSVSYLILGQTGVLGCISFLVNSSLFVLASRVIVALKKYCQDWQDVEISLTLHLSTFSKSLAHGFWAFLNWSSISFFSFSCIICLW